MSSIKSVALAGATGNIGPHILQQLVKSGFEVTVLSRTDSASVPAGVKVKAVDYESKESVQAALAGVDAVVSALGAVALKAQYALIDAAIATGVKRFVPSEYGSDSGNSEVAKLPIFGDKVAVNRHLLEVSKSSSLTYTFIYTGPFLEFCLDFGLLGITKDGKADLLDEGKTPFSTSTFERVGEAIASVLKHADKTANRSIYVNSARITQNQLLDIAKKHSKTDFQVSNSTVVERRQQALDAFNKDPANMWGWMGGMLQAAVFGGDATNGSFQPADNEPLGLSRLSDAELEKVIAGRFA